MNLMMTKTLGTSITMSLDIVVTLTTNITIQLDLKTREDLMEVTNL